MLFITYFQTRSLDYMLRAWYDMKHVCCFVAQFVHACFLGLMWEIEGGRYDGIDPTHQLR